MKGFIMTASGTIILAIIVGTLGIVLRVFGIKFGTLLAALGFSFVIFMFVAILSM